MNLRTQNPNQLPVVTKNLLIINILIFVANLFFTSKGYNFLDKYLSLYFFSSSNFMPHQLITYMFMHGGFTHILFNMFALFMFGRTIEICWGPARFLSFYLITGIGAAILQEAITYFTLQSVLDGLSASEATTYMSVVKTEGAKVFMKGMNYENRILAQINLLVNTPMVGASGAIFGILAAFGMMFPNAELMIIPFPMPIKAKYLVIGYGALELYLGFANRAGDSTAHFAHIGGLITGLILLLYWKQNGTLFGKNYRQK